MFNSVLIRAGTGHQNAHTIVRGRLRSVLVHAIVMDRVAGAANAQLDAPEAVATDDVVADVGRPGRHELDAGAVTEDRRRDLVHVVVHIIVRHTRLRGPLYDDATLEIAHFKVRHFHA